jgi:hypothetical protein
MVVRRKYKKDKRGEVKGIQMIMMIIIMTMRQDCASALVGLRFRGRA